MMNPHQVSGSKISSIEPKVELDVMKIGGITPEAVKERCKKQHLKFIAGSILGGGMPVISKKKETQLSNLKAVFEAAKDFSLVAGIRFSNPALDKDTIVLESGHQPNFLPHSGFWKKLFLLDHIKEKFREHGKKSVALFGFADYNLCTAKLLTRNKLPAFNRSGFESIGFRISEEDRWKRFDYLEKPVENDWKKEMGKIVSHYKKYRSSPDMELNLSELMETLEDCYDRAKNFPDLNAFFITRVCNDMLGLDISFFRYSDLQERRIFLEEWKNIIHNLDEYNAIYNNSINRFVLEIPLCTQDSLPFWYHCGCGAKVALVFKEGLVKGRCSLCSGDHAIGIGELEERFVYMSPNAVSRNIIFSEGIGTNVFISGSGGGLMYGKISDEISRKLGFSLPVTISWKSRDYYIGPAHASALRELGRMCSIATESIGKEELGKIILDKKAELTEMIKKAKENGEQRDIKKYEGQYVNLETLIATVRAVYKVTPSFLDIFVSQGAGQVKKCWEHALSGVDETQTIVKDVIYGNEDIVRIYKKLEEIGD